MPVVAEAFAPSQRRPISVPLLLLALCGCLLFVPLVRPVGFRIPFTSYEVVAYAIYKQNGSPWPWTPDPNQGFGRQTRMIFTGVGHEAFTFRIGPHVCELQRGWSGW